MCGIGISHLHGLQLSIIEVSFHQYDSDMRATSHMRLRAHDHCNLRALIGQKGGDRPLEGEGLKT